MSILLESKLEGFSEKAVDIIKQSPLIKLVEESESRKCIGIDMASGKDESVTRVINLV
jgi:hypothetical protein